VGGGSGHGFKLGPVVGDHVASLVLGEAEPLPIFRLDRPVDVLRTQFGEPS
jgi:glycine/D-amino acid oxidase-like deaminating enzyme